MLKNKTNHHHQQKYLQSTNNRTYICVCIHINPSRTSFEIWDGFIGVTVGQRNNLTDIPSLTVLQSWTDQEQVKSFYMLISLHQNKLLQKEAPGPPRQTKNKQTPNKQTNTNSNNNNNPHKTTTKQNKKPKETTNPTTATVCVRESERESVRARAHQCMKKEHSMYFAWNASALSLRRPCPRLGAIQTPVNSHSLWVLPEHANLYTGDRAGGQALSQQAVCGGGGTDRRFSRGQLERGRNRLGTACSHGLGRNHWATRPHTTSSSFTGLGQKRHREYY